MRTSSASIVGRPPTYAASLASSCSRRPRSSPVNSCMRAAASRGSALPNSLRAVSISHRSTSAPDRVEHSTSRPIFATALAKRVVLGQLLTSRTRTDFFAGCARYFSNPSRYCETNLSAPSTITRRRSPHIETVNSSSQTVLRSASSPGKRVRPSESSSSPKTSLTSRSTAARFKCRSSPVRTAIGPTVVSILAFKRATACTMGTTLRD